MGANVQWTDAEKIVLHFEYTGSWTWDEVFVALAESQQMMDDVDHPVATIVDLTNGRGLPMDSSQYLKQVVEHRSTHTNDSGVTVFLNAETLTKAMLDVIALGDPRASQFVIFTHATTLNDAIQKAKQQLTNVRS